MKRKTKPENLRSEAFMCELFGLKPKQFRVFARKHGFLIASPSNKIHLYDLADALRIFEQFS